MYLAGSNLYKGGWDIEPLPEAPSFYDSNKETIITIGLIAFLAIGSLIAGGSLWYFEVNTITAWSLMGSGAGVLLLDGIIGGVILCTRSQNAGDVPTVSHSKTPSISNQTPHQSANSSDQSNIYRVFSLNVGTEADYSNMCFMRNKTNEKVELKDAFIACRQEKYAASESEKNARIELFCQVFQQFNNPDIICLQETWEMLKNKDLEKILPEGYAAFTCSSDFDHDCTVIWNTSKFTKINHAKIIYDSDYVETSPSPDTIVLLQDNDNGTTICVGSAHLRGFGLDYATMEEKRKALELSKAEKRGDNQAKYDLDTMDAIAADLYIYAGDFNVTVDHYPKRLDIISGYHYDTDFSDTEPTIYDANLREADGETPQSVKLDYIFAKGRRESQVQIQKIAFERTPLNDFNRPSDHRPVGARVVLTKR